MIKSNYKYVVIDDDFNVCESIKKRMDVFDNWHCSGLIVSLTDALKTVSKELPQLLFLDWSIKGGNAFTLLETLEKIKNYKPYIIFFTGYQADHPEIPSELINRFNVNRYLVKPVFENLTNHLQEYVSDAENYCKPAKNPTDFWITTIDKQKLKINPLEIVCISLSGTTSRNKIIDVKNGLSYEIKASWDICEKIAIEYKIDYFFANKRESLINKTFITKVQKPFIWVNNRNLRFEVPRDKWKNVENLD